MEYINTSVRKLGSFFSSPPTASVLGKRKAHHDEGVDDATVENTAFQRLTSEGYTVAESSGGSSSKRRQADPHTDVCATEEDDYYGCPVPQPPQRRIRKPTALTSWANVATQKAERAILKARESMGEATWVAQSDEQEIQDELDRQQHQEESDRKRLLAHKNKLQAAGGVSTLNDLGPTQSTPKSRPPCEAQALPRNSSSTKEEWSTNPNRRAREFLQEHSHDAAAMLEDLQEPAYVCRDTEIRDGVWKMISQIEGFAKEHFSFTVNEQSLLRPALESMEKETVKIVGCVASGGPAGASGWEDLFLAADKRQALVCAIIGNVLVEQVFQHMFFGGTEAQIRQVAAIQYEHRHKDGFDRNALYAAKIRSFLIPTPTKGKASTAHSLHLPLNFTNHAAHTTAALLTHLRPLLALAPTQTDVLPALHSLTLSTALLSLHMRLDAHTAYHFSPVFKDQPFSHSEMDCLNATAMTSTHPRGSSSADAISQPEQARRATLSATERTRMRRDDALVQIALLPALTAFRRGGWETASALAGGVDQRSCEDVGVRARRLTDAWVYCRWGQRRVWRDGRPADEAAVHGVQWREGGFVEFSPGLRDLVAL